MVAGDCDERIVRGFAECTSDTRKHARSFYFASHVLPREKRMASYAVYSFCRTADNVVDTGVRDAQGAVAELERLRQELQRAYDSPSLPEEKMIAFRHTVMKYHIPREYFRDLLLGVEMDLVKNRYASFEELSLYCYRVASVVGLIMTRVLGVSDERALGHAADLGTGMQLTNILRDIGEDYALGRIYLPADELSRFGVTEEEIARGETSGSFIALMKFQIARARDYYRRADQGIPFLPDDGSRSCVLLMSRIYAAILDRIERREYDVIRHRAAVPFPQKLQIAGKAFWGGDLGFALPHRAGRFDHDRREELTPLQHPDH